MRRLVWMGRSGAPQPGGAFLRQGLLSARLPRLLSAWFHDLMHLASRPAVDRVRRLPER